MTREVWVVESADGELRQSAIDKKRVRPHPGERIVRYVPDRQWQALADAHPPLGALILMRWNKESSECSSLHRVDKPPIYVPGEMLWLLVQEPEP